MAKYQLGVIYLLRDRFQIFIPGLPNVLEFLFVQEIVRDLDIVNKDLLFNLLKLFITSNKIPVSSLVIVIADSASIIKDFTEQAQADKQSEQLIKPQEQANEFLACIPFEETSTKLIPITNGVRAYGVNKELYESIKDSFVEAGFEVPWVFPAITVGPEISAKTALDAEAISSILRKIPLLKEFNLLRQPFLAPGSEEKEEQNKGTSDNAESVEAPKQGDKSDKKRIIMLAGVFVVLIIVLILVYVNQPRY